MNFTKIKIGDGSLSGQSIVDLTSLINTKKELTILGIERLTGGKAKLRSYFTNADILTGFYWRELGVFAQDPDEGEILYCYGNAGTNAEYIPAGGGPDVVERYINVITLVGNATNVSATLGSEIYVTQADFDNHTGNAVMHVTQVEKDTWNAKETPAGAQAKADVAEAAANAYTDQKVGDLAGAGRTTETVKGNADALAAHLAETIKQGVHGGLPAHKSTHAIGGSDPITPADIGAVNKAGDTMTGNLTAPKFISTVATGTSPLSVSSITLVTNLNVDMLDNYHAGNSSGQIPVSNGTVNTNLNADLLDGHDGSYYLPVSSYTASDVLTKIKTVDGEGSGLDADTLRGKTPNDIFPPYTVGDIVLIQDAWTPEINSTTPTKTYEKRIDRSGSLRIKFGAKVGATSITGYAQIYRNGSPVGTLRSTTSTTYVTFTEDISGWNPGDLVQLYCYVSNNSYKMYLYDFTLCVAKLYSLA
ncbi:hypothetical protein FWJ32_07195 [Calorimonas adulescens]|uniref:Uncharacterized protein n=2 Tax=Calorimonas adulescens TaxID=2606906 RepID=A0A5D8QBM0_9THEO|nr:hypothetical protein FWJ32_07195 [Calorimonas adulescens]